MTIKQVNDALSLLACLAIDEMKSVVKSREEIIAIYERLRALPPEVTDHFFMLWQLIETYGDNHKEEWFILTSVEQYR